MYTLPNAKINIGLNITNRRPDGYHEIETIFYPIRLTDSLEIKTAPALCETPVELHLSGFTIDGNPQDNLVTKVCLAMSKRFNLPPIDVFLGKHIPMGAGLGGGSSDAAFAAKMLNELFSIGLDNKELEAIVAPFGADCPFFVTGQPVYAEGKGDKFSPVNINLRGLYIALVKPPIHISTREAYCSVTPRPSMRNLADDVARLPIEKWNDIVSNQFEETLFKHYPLLSALKQTLFDMGALYASMSGSGSAIYGIFNRPIDNIKEVFPDCFTYTDKL